MPYGDFTTLAKVEAKLGCTVEEADLTEAVPPLPTPAALAALLARNLALAVLVTSERMRSELLVSPMLQEVKFAHPKELAFFAGVTFDVDPSLGLNGQLDYLLSRNSFQRLPRAPVCVVAEAKGEDMSVAIPQCLAAMVGAYRFNVTAGLPPAPLYGAATTGRLWQFLKFDETRAFIDREEHLIDAPDKIYGVLTAMALGTPAV
jgi:hypothetical protein